MAINISASSRRVVYTANGSATAFAVPFQFYADEDLKVYVNGVLKTLSNDYTVTGEGQSTGGTVTFNTAPTNTHKVVIVGDAPIKRESHFPLSGKFNVDTLNVELNKGVIIDQQLAAKIERTLRLADSDPGNGLELPDATTRANKFLGFDLSGNPIAAAGVSPSLGPVSAFIATLLDDVDAATARATLGVSSGSASSESAQGIIELATQAETNTGTDDARAITPLKLKNVTYSTVTMDTANDLAIFKDATDGTLKMGLIPAGAAGEVNTAATAGSGASSVKGKTGTVIDLRGFKLNISNTSSGTGNGLADCVLSGSWSASGDDITLSLTFARTYTTFTTGGGGGPEGG